MRTALAASVVLLVAPVAGFAQSDAPAFEVASVKVSELAKKGGEGSRRQSVQTEPGSLTMRNVPLTNAIGWAYGVLDFQVSGPGWLNEQRYDIVAKATGRAPDDQLKLMLQTLLAERLKMAVHRDEKVMPYYILTVAKGGPKFKESTTEGDPDLHPGANRMTAIAQHMTVSRFCQMLSQVLHAPIQDQTGLNGRYDATVDLTQVIAAFPQGPQPDDIPAMIMNGIQDMLGLKLEAKKGPVEVIVVDRAEKIPTEN
jgi:uncharacterized protein (TIGR03435 family)